MINAGNEVHMQNHSMFSFILGLAFGIGLIAIASGIATGYRVDAEGTSPAASEMVIQWGGVLVAAVLLFGLYVYKSVHSRR